MKKSIAVVLLVALLSCNNNGESTKTINSDTTKINPVDNTRNNDTNKMNDRMDTLHRDTTNK